MEVQELHDVPSPGTRSNSFIWLWEVAALLVETKGISFAGFILLLS